MKRNDIIAFDLQSNPVAKAPDAEALSDQIPVSKTVITKRLRDGEQANGYIFDYALPGVDYHIPAR